MESRGGGVVGGAEGQGGIKEDPSPGGSSSQQGRWCCYLLSLRSLEKGWVTTSPSTLLEQRPYWCLPSGVLPRIHSRQISSDKMDSKEGELFEQVKNQGKPRNDSLNLKERFRAHKRLRGILSIYHSKDKFHT